LRVFLFDEYNLMSEDVAKNTAYMTIASVAQKVISFIYFTLVARLVGAEGTGKYFFALSFTTIFVIFIDMGLTNVLIREASKFKQKAQTYFSNVFGVKLVLSILVYLGAIIVINVMGYPEVTRNLVYLSAVTMVFDSLHKTNYGTIRSLGNLKWEAYGMVASQAITLLLGSIFLIYDFPLIFLILAFTIPSCLNFIYSSFVLNKKYKIDLQPKLRKNIIKKLGKIAAPFALAAIFARGYSYLDTVILSKLAGDKAVGWYSIPRKIANAFQFFPMALVASLYPKFSEHYKNSKEELTGLFEKSIKYMLLLAVPISVGIYIIAPEIINTFYTKEYLKSVLPLRILVLSIIFSFVAMPIGSFLNACDRQKTQTTIVGIVLVVNIVLNFLLIPKLGVEGAAWAALVGNFVLAVGGYFFVAKIADISHSYLLKTKLKVLLSAIIMGILVWYVNIYMHFVFSIFAGILVYPAMLFLTETINKSQVREAISLIR
jgi:O-antigen/teichoic acid export membrane protein